MNLRTFFVAISVTSCLLTRTMAQDGETGFDPEVARQGVAFLETYCVRCHGVDQKYPGLDLKDRATLLRPKDTAEEPFIVPGDPDESRIWDVVHTEYMPPERQPQPTDEQRAVLRRWIEAGAHFPPPERPAREFLGEETVLAAIEADLGNLTEQEISHTRYFSLAHLWNDTQGSDPTTEEDLQLVRAGLSKLVNSLSTRSRIVLPRILDPEFGTILAIDMRDYGWDEWHWNEVAKLYPYALKVSSRSATNIYRLTQTRIPYLRADWFIAMASRPPLYHRLLNIPVNAKALESQLGVDIFENFNQGKLARAAFQESGVSQQNRMVERHDTTGGGRYYWKSYDIKPATGEKGDFTRRPLGPLFERAAGRQLAAFEHDGGEIIYSLPNGLQAYMLVAGNDQRIDQGPPDVVYDPNSHSGSFLITNGISCMGCHKHGMFAWEKDEIRPLFEDRRGQRVADKVLQLFPPNEQMQQLVQQDRDHFLTALTAAIGPFVRVGDNQGRSIRDYEEPITKVSNRYLLDVTMATAARELGLADAQQLAPLLQLSTVRRLGLGNWNNPDGVVAREAWEKAYGRFARELGIGIPILKR